MNTLWQTICLDRWQGGPITVANSEDGDWFSLPAGRTAVDMGKRP
jgi:hypothetical protein